MQWHRDLMWKISEEIKKTMDLQTIKDIRYEKQQLSIGFSLTQAY